MIRTLTLLLMVSCASAQASSISPARLIATARASLDGLSSALPGELVFTPSALAASELKIQSDTAQVTLQAAPIDGSWPRKRVGVPVQVLVDGVPHQTRMVWFTVQWWMERPTYGRAFADGTPSGQLALVNKRMDVAGLLAVEDASTQIGASVAGRLIHAVRAGDLVQARDFAAVPAVARRDAVTLRVRRGAVELRMPAVAAADGQPGDAIAVLPQGTRTPVQARVIAIGEVSIEQ
ncbi:flagella basal body P-ring formation protein FlgA [Xanthomonas oryzae]|uniref:flagella basal body P-ring formation protein FlgA n=1 Tax=Xanthomonas oryzae TaxID=347 RepID=UPI001033E3BA|nr:flagella basal body P-ring formation protein FlgA [Xanthomonas oryzae]QBG97562.1 flagellar biosynthesis protein FlgA [Xanthomonas oryzae]QBG98358.1 flagellar biosynthesis protein FlgA [Xanthomonas oryzae]